jgi:predicted permease
MKFPWRQRTRRNDEINAEIRNHLEMSIRDRIERGESPEQARTNALREFGNVGLVKEATREMWGWVSLDRLMQDVRYGWRLMRKHPGFSLFAIFTLALGIGANTAIFTVVNALLLRPLPYPDAERLVVVDTTVRRDRVEVRSTSYPDFVDWRDQNSVLEGIAALSTPSFSLLGGGEPDRVSGELVSWNYFSLLGVGAIRGRTFLPEDDATPDARRVAVIGAGLWQRRFGGTDDVVGQTIRLSDGNYTVVGIMPEGFRGISDLAEIWLPMMMISSVRVVGDLQIRNQRWLTTVARLKPGVSINRAQTDLDGIMTRLEQNYPGTNQNRGALVTSVHEWQFGRLKPTLWVLLGAVGFVLLITCANVANLLLQRAATRQKETAIRLALGSTTGRLLQQLLTESLLMSLAGGALGILFAVYAADFLVALSPATFPSYVKLTLDARVLGFTLLISLMTGVIFGIAPALQASRPALNEALKDSGRGTSGGLGRSRLLGALVVSEIALALVLLVGSGLMIRSLQHLQSIDPGFDSTNLLMMRFSLPTLKYTREQVGPFEHQLRERLRSLPGVKSAAISSDLPLGGTSSAGPIEIEGRTAVPPDQEIRMFRHRVSTGFFSTLGIQFLKGRDFTPDDHAKAPGVVIISDALAKRYWAGEDPINKRLKESGSTNPWLTVIGVVSDVKYRGLPNNPNHDPDVYFPILQRPLNNLSLAVRTQSDPTSLVTAIRREFQNLDPDLPLYNVTTMEQQVAAQTTQTRFSTWLLSIFGTLALLLSAVGIYSVMAYAVEQRTHEIGIRLAMGANTRDVLILVMGQGARLALFGVGLGVSAALLLTQLIKRLLFGVAAADPLTYAGIAILLTTVVMLACWIPARRATKVDPLVALRHE